MKERWRWLLAVSVILFLFWFFNPGPQPLSPQQPAAASKPGASPGTASSLAAVSGAGVARTEPIAHEDSSKLRGTNAADIYKRAYALLNNLSEEEKQLLRSRNKSDPAKAAALFEKIQPILALLKQGAKTDYCDWDLEILTPYSILPPMSLIQQLGDLTTWAASQLYAQNPEAALELLSDQASLGDSVSNYTTFGAHVQNVLESEADALIRENFSSLTPELIEKYKSLLGPSCAKRDFPEAFQTDVALLREFSKNPSGDAPRVAEFQKWLQASGSPERLDRFMDFCHQGSKMLEYSDAEFGAWRAQLESMAQGTPLEGDTVYLEKLRSNFLKRIIEREMLMGAIGILQNQRLAVSSQQFIYREMATGFELESRARFDGKPVILQFPKAK